MNKSTSKKTVLVTGAASGIGKACALHLLQTGHDVLAFDLQSEALSTAFPDTGPQLALRAGDVSRTESCAAAVEAAVDRFGKLDAVIHWAARYSIKTWDELTADEFNHLLAVNVTGSFLIAQAAARHMRKNQKGAIILTSSTAVIHAPIGGTAGNGGPAYVTSKAAIIGLVRTLSRALGPDGIRVNGVAPGVTDTPMIQNYSTETRNAQIRQSPSGRIGTPEDIAEAGCMLITEAARYVSGEVLIVNGGTSFG